MKILVAEDDPDQLELRSLLLSQSGFETIPARDSAAALRAAAKRNPDCAVVDLRFPAEEHGLGLIRELKRLNASMRIIVLTGMNAARFERLPEYALVDEVIEKGASSVRLVEIIRAWDRAQDCVHDHNRS
jgi:DNA-binding response OmpR family regulator